MIRNVARTLSKKLQVVMKDSKDEFGGSGVGSQESEGDLRKLSVANGKKGI